MTAVTVRSDKGEELTIVHVADSWEHDAAFTDAGAEHDLPSSTVIGLRQGRLRRVTVKPLYAEFDDGTRVGPDADSVHECLLNKREKFRQASQEALDSYTLGGTEALEQVLQTKRELSRLAVIKATHGIPAVLRELKKHRRLAP